MEKIELFKITDDMENEICLFLEQYTESPPKHELYLIFNGHRMDLRKFPNKRAMQDFLNFFNFLIKNDKNQKNEA